MKPITPVDMDSIESFIAMKSTIIPASTIENLSRTLLFVESKSGITEARELKKMRDSEIRKFSIIPAWLRKTTKRVMKTRLNTMWAFQDGIFSLEDYPSVHCDGAVGHRENRI